MSFHGPAALKNEPGVDVSMYPGRRLSVGAAGVVLFLPVAGSEISASGICG
jgi:hypothetical protein